VNRTQLCTGTQAIEIRRAGPQDQDAIVAFLDGLSLQTRYLRFFAGFAPTSPSMLRILTGGSGDVLIALCRGTVVGHGLAAYVPAESAAGAGPGPGAGLGPVAHIGVVVADGWQDQGIGSGLMAALSAAVRARGASALVLDVLRENSRVIAMITEHWPGVHYDQEAESVTVPGPVPLYRPAARELPPAAASLAPARASLPTRAARPAELVG
jgi:GNAT superfamily N-acetyltransferase